MLEYGDTMHDVGVNRSSCLDDNVMKSNKLTPMCEVYGWLGEENRVCPNSKMPRDEWISSSGVCDVLQTRFVLTNGILYSKQERPHRQMKYSAKLEGQLPFGWCCIIFIIQYYLLVRNATEYSMIQSKRCLFSNSMILSIVWEAKTDSDLKSLAKYSGVRQPR